MPWGSMLVEPVDSPDGIARVNVIRVCPLCDQPSHVEGVLAEGFMEWQAGRHVQSALPDLSPAEAEILTSGSHDACFNRAFPPDADPFDGMFPE